MHTWVVYIQKKGNSQVSKRSLVTEAIDPRIMMNRSLRYSIINPVQLLVDTHRLDFIAYGSIVLDCIAELPFDVLDWRV